MLTRLKVSGFKNLVDVDIRFGPFTCVAGANGVGKSNLFDAIRFLSALADESLIEAARSVRDEHGRSGDIRSLFHRVGDHYSEVMRFEADMIVPQKGEDDLGQTAVATITLLRYSLKLAYSMEPNSFGSLEILSEELVPLRKGDVTKHLPFSRGKNAWRNSVVQGRRTVPFISTVTDGEPGDRLIMRHQDGGSSGKPYPILARKLPRTVLSVAKAAESPTAVMARNEMRSWRLLQLEPTALRRPDDEMSPVRIGSDGAHLPATLYRLSKSSIVADVYAHIASRLRELIDDTSEITVEFDPRRESLTLMVTGKDGTIYPGRALSDGTLRFLALAIMELDPLEEGVLCLEEPENGIHPERIPAMLRLLQDIAVDTSEAVSDDNPLRQVIINTHSPSVVQEIPDESLLVAELKEHVRDGQRFKSVVFSCLPDTWRSSVDGKVSVAARGVLVSYLNPGRVHRILSGASAGDTPSAVRRVADREDLRMMIPIPGLLERTGQ